MFPDYMIQEQLRMKEHILDSLRYSALIASTPQKKERKKMKVKQLIELLKTLDPNRELEIKDGNEYFIIEQVRDYKAVEFNNEDGEPLKKVAVNDDSLILEITRV